MSEPKAGDREIALGARVEAEQLRQLAASVKVAALMGPFWAVVVPLVLYFRILPELGSASLTTCVAAITITVAWSVAVLKVLRRLEGASDLESNVASWSRRLRLFLFTSPIMVAAFTLLLWEPGNGFNHIFMAITVYGSALAQIGIYSAHWRIYRDGQILLFAIIIARALTEAMPIDLFIAAFSVPFCVTALHCGWLMNRHMSEALMMRFRNESLAYDLAAARDEAVRQGNEAVAQRHAAQAASQAKSVFLASMSHELRTPLNAVIGFSDILKSELLGPLGNPQYLDYANDIFVSGHHLLGLINDVLDLSKIEAGRIEIELKRLSTEDAIETALRLTRGRALQNCVSLDTNVASDCPDTFADSRAVTQILVNLIDNAIKFTPEGGKIMVSAARAGTCVEYAVADTGRGISPEDVHRVFKPFEQLDNRYARSEGGTGLGLALVDGLVKLHNGSCAVESELGAGTTVRVSLSAFETERAGEKAVA